ADGKPAGIERSSTGADRLAHDWRWTRAPVAAPRDAAKAQLYLVVWSTGGDVFIDDVCFEPAEMPRPRTPAPWAPGDKLRVMYFSNDRDSLEDVQRVRDTGFNVASFLYYKCYEPERIEPLDANLGFARQVGLQALVAVWLSRTSSPEFRDRHPLVNAAGVEHKTTASIYHREWWDEWFTPTCLQFVRRSQDEGIIGLWVDFELYDEPRRIADVCWCDRCMQLYERDRGVTIEGEDVPARVKWLREHELLEDYRNFHAARLEGFAAELRARTDAINPDFMYGDFPYYGKIADRAFARALGTERAPFLIAPEYTYRLQSEHYSDATAVQLAVNYCEERQRQIQRDGLHALLLAGICPETDPDFMRDKIIAVCGQADGYWLWAKRIIDSRRAHFSREAMTDEEAQAAWDALEEANKQIAAQ
ncbi:MAG: hypothetical protein J7M38_15355, partial [Armatimonadetes bacterium]|nr:hypothetical protein [Armatimonadota bacterium]